MSNVGVYGFEIPHGHVQPARDMIVVQLPFPPERSKGGIITPDDARDMMAYNVAAGRIFAMGPLAFTYKDGAGGLQRQDAKIGDWVLFRPYAGTMVQGGTIMVTSGWRYISSFADVIGVIPAAHMPAPDTLEWERENKSSAPKLAGADDFKFDSRKMTPFTLNGAPQSDV